jgi:ribosome biogenesis GTPase A
VQRGPPSAVKEDAQAAWRPPKGTIAFLPQACLFAAALAAMAKRTAASKASRRPQAVAWLGKTDSEASVACVGGEAVGFPSGSGSATFFNLWEQERIGKMEHINWYPGHMKKTRELIQENLKMVDTVIEVIDARIPVSSRNPIIDELVKNKRRIIILNKSDLADPQATDKWVEHFKSKGYYALIMNSASGAGTPQLMKLLNSIQEEKNEGKIIKKALRMMIVGVPNVGKSSLINRLTGKKSAKTGNKPGVTRGKQWLNLGNDMQLLDTPGILWPKFEDPSAGLDLAFCGSIKDEILDIATLALELITVLQNDYEDLLKDRYKLEELGATPLETMERIAEKRGFIQAGRKIYYERTGRTVMDEFRAGVIGRITLEKV